jgi:hypothetical protein
MDIEALKNLDFSQFTDIEVLEHFNFRCQIDGSNYEVACHHIVFKSQGGVSRPRIPLCNNCHMKFHGNPDFRKKWEVRLLKIAGIFYQLKTQFGLF